MVEIIILSIVQGVTEFLPISSSSHLIVLSEIFEFKSASIFLDISLHIGSFLAVVVFFNKEIINFINNKKLFFLVFISSLPLIIIALIILKFGYLNDLRNLTVVGLSTIFFAFLMYVSDKVKSKKKLSQDWNFKNAIIIGVLHSLSLIPGVSRSGIAITACRMLGFNRVQSAQISFLLSIPTLLAVTIYGFISLYNQNNLNIQNLNVISVFLSFIFSYATMFFLIDYLRKFNLTVFVVYRILLGSLIIFYVY